MVANNLDPTVFLDVADSLGLPDASYIEKDYYAVQLIKELAELEFEEYSLCFSGGTCLSKIYVDTKRMSEDIDMKMVFSGDKTLSGNQRKNLRGKVRKKVLSQLNKTYFKVGEVTTGNESAYVQIQLEYPYHYRPAHPLRPEIQLELTESELLQKSCRLGISSLYAKQFELIPEVLNFPSVKLESILAEKVIALLRRTANAHRNPTEKDKDDERLIRHLYDINMIINKTDDAVSIVNIVNRVIEIDKAQFGNSHKEFSDNPHHELMYGLDLLEYQKIYQQRYEEFIDPLIYNQKPPTWNKAIASLVSLADELFK